MQFGRTPLHFAAEYDRLEIAAFLVERGAAIEAMDVGIA
jgi:ankyrin repeat protein